MNEHLVTSGNRDGLENYWLPFTPNRYFKRNPRIIASAEGAYYTLADGRRVFDCLSGLWCCPLGHGNAHIAEAIKRQAETLDYATAFQMSNPTTLSFAARVADMAPAGLDHVFFANSGSESVDTALKIAIGYHRMKGEAHRTRIIGRERGYHGVGMGGISAGGMTANRKMFAPLMLNGVDHLPHTYDRAQTAFTHGQPEWGAHLADDLERLVALHDASTIAAVIVEPMQGSAGVVVPPVGYLERLREICTKHGILLIFDEVITGFGRLGANFASQRLNVRPDMMTFAKAVTNGVIPMGGVIVADEIYDAYMSGPEEAVELYHGYTYSGHPMAAAAGHATLDVMERDGLIPRAAELEPVLETAIHALKGTPGIVDIRNFGLAAAVDLEPFEGQPGLRAMRVFERALQTGLLVRFTGETIAMAPPFISTDDELQTMCATLGDAIASVTSPAA
ncbi:Omega-amino acid--pyruvate aminotransferase [Methyloligella halotolerans]|uniref:Omega-amino acid--pyruvate aminotransferase n=1 Tax=Methyloligella halotolerans TaxID=1177755 RepID=A0A1E2S409_9HYPH|nr:aspartate aminotransferase family protein [Methyloligella halotolerans]ODA69058.1 Omega-amino acid--pyruvate aminotransferase [Methyloligella halotolerans]